MRLKIFLLSFIFFSILGCESKENNKESEKFSEQQSEQSEVDSTYLVAIDEQPTPVGGINAILKYIVYPPEAKKNGIQGKVFIKAFVDENGDVVKTEVLKGIGAGCDEVAADAIKKTKFIPGKHKGKNVKCQVVVPVHFVLQ
ncbi:MAG: energy transducer TonB [Ignavibacteriales bacterium]|nr:energy transducer TonB [Ignavibacteriales bacterium]